MPLELHRTVPGEHLRLVGDVDVHCVADLRNELGFAIDAGVGDLVVDCAQLRLVDATGLGALLAAHRRAQRAGRRLILTAVGADLARLLHVSRLARVLHVERAAA